MSVFFSYRIKGLEGAMHAHCWHPRDALLAVACPGVLSVYNERAEVKAEIVIDCDVSVMSWHPWKRFLCCGFADGRIGIWVDKGRSMHFLPAQHQECITLTKWSTEGRRAIVADGSGSVTVWKVDSSANVELFSRMKLRGPITQCVFRTFPHVDYMESIECPPFLLSGESGPVTLANDLGDHKEVFQAGGAVTVLLFNDITQSLLTMTRNSIMFVHRFTESKIQQIFRGKVSSAPIVGKSGGIIDGCFIGTNIIAYLSNEKMIRIWDTRKEENYILAPPSVDDKNVHTSQRIKVDVLASPSHGGESQDETDSLDSVRPRRERDSSFPVSSRGEHERTTTSSFRDDQSVPVGSSEDLFTAISYNPLRRILAASMQSGRILFWKCLLIQSASTYSSDWELIAEVHVGGIPKRISWDSTGHHLCAQYDNYMSIVYEGPLKRDIRGSISTVQLSATEAQLLDLDKNIGTTVKFSSRIVDLSLTDEYLVMTDGKIVEVHTIEENDKSITTRKVYTFDAPMSGMVARFRNVFTLSESGVEVRSMDGTIIRTLSISEHEGQPMLIRAGQNHIIVITTHNVLHVWEVTRKDVQQVGVGRSLFEERTSGQVLDADINVDGSFVAFVGRMIAFGATETSPISDEEDHDSREQLFLYSQEHDSINCFDFNGTHSPVNVRWDVSDRRLLASHVVSHGGDAHGGSRPMEVATLFATQEEIFLEDIREMEQGLSVLVGIRVPHLIFSSMDQSSQQSLSSTMSSSISGIQLRWMRDFEGIEQITDEVKRALLNFSFHLTCGNMDEAYRNVRKIKSASVWKNLARVAIKTKRLDVAQACLRKMGEAKGSFVLREAENVHETEARLAIVAVELGMLDEAIELYSSCGRYDLLNDLYQARGLWSKALEVAEKHDRIHLRTTYHLYGRHLENEGKFDQAIVSFEKANTYRVEVPRMLYMNQRLDELKEYIAKKNDRELFRWWAQYLEGNGQLDEGITFYKKAEDYLSVVRVYCFAEDHESAAEIVRQSQDRSAAFHLARSLESIATEQTDLTEEELLSKLRLSIHYYQFSGQYRHALRLAIQIDAEQDILSIAMQDVDDPVVLNDAATYFEDHGMIDRAVMMYQKGGNVSRAVDMCIEGKLFDVLTELVTKMDENTDPAILRRCANYFMDNLEFNKAVDLLVLSGEYDQALSICEERNVYLSEEIVEKITPPKTDNPKDNERRVETLRKLGELAQRQGNFHLATKKFTQAGDKLQAMRCLLQSGDTDRIVFFANVSKQKEIYILAANYLQNLNWRDDARIMKQIVTFYVKAKALENVAGFYDACAQVEIDDYRAYDKALSALREAEKYLGKARIHGKEAKLSALQEKIHLMERFINARELVKSNPDDMIRTCEDLLRERDIDRAVRTGDIYALLVEFHYGNGNMEEAYQIIERMRDRGIDLSFYLDANMTRTIHSRMGIEVDTADDHDAISEEIIDEELDEDVDDMDDNDERM